MKAKKNGQYADLSAFIELSKLEMEALEISTGPKVRRKGEKIKEDKICHYVQYVSKDKRLSLQAVMRTAEE